MWSLLKMKILEKSELLLKAGVNGELSVKGFLAEKRSKTASSSCIPGFPRSISHGDLVEIRQHSDSPVY